MFYRRETSPTASVRSDFQPRNFHQPFNQGYSYRSTYNGRGGSPVSMRSIDSTASVATDIAQTITNSKFSNHECRIILQAINKKRKNNNRSRAERRRKKKMCLQSVRNRSGDDSGEQGSNSSMSSDDCASTRTGYRNYKENVPQSLPSLDSRSVDTNFRNDNRDTREYAQYALENPFRRDTHPSDSENMTSLNKNIQNKPNINFKSQINPRNTFSTQSSILSGPKNMTSSQSYTNPHGNMYSNQRNTLNAFVYSTKSLQNTSTISQKERFNSRFQFPSQRFNKSVMPIEEHEENENVKAQNGTNKNKRKQRNEVEDNSSENDEIFLDRTIRPKQPVSKNNNIRPKRNVECLDDVPVSTKKKCKTTSLNNNKVGQKTKNITGNNDFVFVIPQFPIRKKPTEKLISKSAEPFSDVAINVPEDNTRLQAVDASCQEKEAECEPAESTRLTNSDVSMRPSFMKRKLFTQTLDVTERKNNSSESLSTDSPQSNIYSALSREKHKTRKLATSQSLLSRDVNQDDNNLLDLIHKIVPPSQVNTTNIAKPSQTRASGHKTASDGDDKWDITSILSTCNNDSVSDTYTDDEIFKVVNGDKTKEKDNKKQDNANVDKMKTNVKPEPKKVAMTKCNVIVHKLKMAPPASTQMKSPVKAGPAKTVTLSNSRIDDFWNTDVESDYDCPATPPALRERSLHGTPNNIATPKQSSIKSFLEVRPNSFTNNTSKNTKTQTSSLVVNKNDSTLIKALKKQTNKKNSTKPSSKTSKNTNNKEAQPKETDKIKKAPAVKIVKTRRQKNLSAAEESLTLNDDPPIKAKCSEANSKPGNVKKTKEKINKTTQPSSESTKTRRNTSLRRGVWQMALRSSLSGFSDESGVSAVKIVKTRRQKNLSAAEESLTLNDNPPIKAKCSEANSKKSNVKKTKEKINKTTQPSSESTKTRRNTSLRRGVWQMTLRSSLSAFSDDSGVSSFPWFGV